MSKKDDGFKLTGDLRLGLTQWLKKHEPRFTADEWVKQCLKKLGYTPDNSELDGGKRR